MLSPAVYSNLDFIYDLYMHPSINSYLLYEQMDKTDFQPIFEQLLVKKALYLFSWEDTPAGMCKLVPHAHRASHVIYIGGLAIDPSQSGKGLGVKMIEEVLALCKKRGFLRIELSVTASNEKAIHVIERAGFEKEGVLRKYTHLEKENKYVDELLYSILV